MASAQFSSPRSSVATPTMAVPGNSGGVRGGCSFGRANIFPRKYHDAGLRVRNVATRLPETELSPEKGVGCGGKLAAWTSIRQERWEGELVVQGEIPLWLVCSYILYALQQYFHLHYQTCHSLSSFFFFY